MKEFDDYSSHLTVFEKILSTFDIKSVLEFGVGKYSSPFFANNGLQVLSVEQENQEWYEKMRAEIRVPNWNIVFEPDPKKIFANIDATQTPFDIVFSDGAQEARCLVANLAMERGVPFVVLHDAEVVWYYRWDLLNIPANYSRFNYCHREGKHKVTTVLTSKDGKSIDQWTIPDHDRVLLAYGAPQQPVISVKYQGDSHFLSQER